MKTKGTVKTALFGADGVFPQIETVGESLIPSTHANLR